MKIRSFIYGKTIYKNPTVVIWKVSSSATVVRSSVAVDEASVKLSKSSLIPHTSI